MTPREPLCNNLRFLFLVAAGILIISSPLHAQDNGNFNIDLGGYVKELGQIAAGNDFTEIRYDNILHHRLESDWKLTEHIEFRADIRNRLISGYSIKNTPGVEEFYERDPNYLDLTWVWFDTEYSILQSNIDRFHASYINGPWEVHAGRQRVNWGRTFVWNPNDLFNNYAFLDFDYEERPGVDALLAQYNWSYASSVEAGIRVGNSWDESVVGGIVRTSLGSYDVQFIGGHYLDYIALGTGWAGYLEDAGFKGEFTYFHPEDNFFEERGHITATAGFDYMLNNGIYLQTELLYNGGYNRSLNPLDRLVRPPSADNLFIATSGYLLNGSYQIHPLVSGNMSLLGSFDRTIFIIIPQINVSLTENLDFLLLSQLLKGSVFREAVDTPNLFFFRLKYSY
ncbi:hypothetical protein G3570_03590 [Balneolaceae bacterium YR4-1]|uniref:Alginate export domain-containing protein n=1 Tax=Halalkalibaculum roseum TaxID=2709311 RepID=A0A6M1SL15_9BACT|nr:hypothetical protein [Halalkalibaculum roseum]NGP75699.1 hypothetical protein [Halalkalibaculum roseum]